MRITTLILLIAIFFPLVSFAPKEKKPSCILFMLHKSTRKIEALKRRNLVKEASIIEAEDEDLNQSIMLDFNLKFNFCPVYFFYSEDFDNVIAKKWDVVKFIPLKNCATVSAVSLLTEKYFIGEVNYPPIQKYKKGEEDPIHQSTGISDESYANGNDPYGILLHNENFKLLRTRLEYFNSNVKVLSKKPRKIKFMGAEKLNLKLKNYYN